ncbi:protein activator of alkane oxidation PraB [Caulobacter endophyticus]|uniref:Protein activator of alkane oxidation PraB n=1 Tax=Caulobacter endophyticus TaxID=2172652 RepID=A0A2T9JMH3_9CAUL|nr:protein activator of alkane oxidation PraB [Caulobacter endophyticus]PVM84881.1 protein activator of alkane oxidation PraB [Caulobacter endophyticus]
MLKYAAVASALAVAGLATPLQASAQTFTPASGPVTITGSLLIQETTTVSCDVTLTGQVMGGGSYIWVTGGSFAPGDWQCGWLIGPVGFSWQIHPFGAQHVIVYGMEITTVLGSCSGTPYIRWSSDNYSPNSSTMELIEVTIGGASSWCTLTGSLSVSGVTMQ